MIELIIAFIAGFVTNVLITIIYKKKDSEIFGTLFMYDEIVGGHTYTNVYLEFEENGFDNIKQQIGKTSTFRVKSGTLE